MKPKWQKGMFGVEALDPDSEFLPREYKVRVADLRKFGIPTVPVVGQTSYRQLAEPAAWHVHERCVELVYCSAGSCEYESKGTCYRLGPGMMFVSKSDEEHRQLSCPKGYSTFYLLFKPVENSTCRWFESALAKIPRLFSCGRTVPLRFGKILSLAESEKTGQELQIRLQTEVRALILDVLDSAAKSVPKKRYKVLDKIAEKMRHNPERSYPLDGLVAESGLSKASFIALFKEEHGHSPHAFLLNCRIDAAKVLLCKGLSESEIAERLGFTTPQNLTRTFRNFVGLTPRLWLKTQKRKWV